MGSLFGLCEHIRVRVDTDHRAPSPSRDDYAFVTYNC